MKLRTQLIAGIVVFALLLVIISGVIITTNQELENLMVQEDLANNIALQVGELGYLSNDYILYRETPQAERWNAKYDSIAGDIALLSSDQPEQRVLASNLASNLRNTRSVFDEIVSSPVQSGEAETGFVQLSWSRIAVQNQGMVFDAGRLARLVRDQETALRAERLLSVFALMGTFVAFLLTSYFLFYRRTVRSISNLQKGAQAVGSGNFSYTIEDRSDNEIGDLSRSFNRMITDLNTITASKVELEREVASRKQAEEDLLYANDRLIRSEQDLIHRNVELNALNEEVTTAQEELQQNVDELTRAEGELRATSGRLEALYTSMNEGLALHDIVYTGGNATDYIIRDVNPAYETITGIRKDAAVGKSASELYGSGTPPFLDVYARVASGGGSERFETFFPPMNKHFAISVFSPERGKFATVFSDITERKMAEKALEDANVLLEQRVAQRTVQLETAMGIAGTERQRLYDVLETLPVYVCLLDAGYHMPFANRYFRETFGESGGRCCYDFLFSLTAPCETCETYTVMKTKAPHHWYWTGPNGKDYDIYDFPFTDSDGSFLILEMGIDITERNKAIAALEEARDVLEVRVQERTKDLLDKNTELGAINEELTATQEELQQNIDELTRAESSLRDSERRLARSQEISHLGSWELDLVNDRLEWSDEVYRIFGLQPQEFGATYEAFLAAVHPDDRSAVDAAYSGSVREGRDTYEIDHRVVRNDTGEIRYVHEKCEHVRDKAGEIIRSVGMVHDITETWMAGEALRETTQYLDNLINYANAPIIVWDPRFRITRFNHAFEQLTGMEAGEAIGQHLSIVFPEEFRDDAMDVIKRTMGGERLNVVELPILRKGGQVRVVLWNSATLYESDGTTVSSTIAQGQDITGRKTAEAENIRAREEWERTFNTVPDLIAILDKKHRIIRVNRAMADRLGTIPEKCTGMLCHEAVHGTTVPPEFCPHTKTCADGKQHIVEVHEPGLGGTFIVSTTPLFNPDGGLLGTVHVAHNITERKKAEEELKRRHNDLSAAYEEITATQEELHRNVEELSLREQELLQSEAKLKDALTEKEILLSEIHHRVKNNLAAFISLLSLDGTYEDTDAGRALKKDLQNRARSMALIHETLYQTGKFSSVDMGIYLTTLIDQVAATFRGSVVVHTVVDARGVALDLARATTAGLIINELVTNSFKYAFPPSFDCMEVRGEPCTVRVSFMEEDGTILLSVADNGRGLPPDLDPLAAKSLGLRLVNFLGRHQLRAEITVRENKGTEFLFRLNKTEDHA